VNIKENCYKNKGKTLNNGFQDHQNSKKMQLNHFALSVKLNTLKQIKIIIHLVIQRIQVGKSSKIQSKQENIKEL